MIEESATLPEPPAIPLAPDAAGAAAAPKVPRGRPRKDALGREADQQALVAAASGIVREAGPAALTARAVAARAGTAVGSVYAAFPSLEALRLGVNTVTTGLLGKQRTFAPVVTALGEEPWGEGVVNPRLYLAKARTAALRTCRAHRRFPAASAGGA